MKYVAQERLSMTLEQWIRSDVLCCPCMIGVPLMSVGERAILRMTHDFAYGARGVPPAIPGFSNLVFDVELLEIRD